jgi:hypothetical protein
MRVLATTKILAALAGVAALAVALGAAPGRAGAATVPRPVIVSMSVSGVGGAHAGDLGKPALVTLRVRGATSCSFEAQHQPFSSLYIVRTVPCASGLVRVLMPVVKNPYAAAAKLAYAVHARGPGGLATRSVTVTAAAASQAAPQTPAASPPAPAPAPPSPPPLTPTTSDSENWAGYSLGGGPFTAVSGTFNVPNIVAGPGDTVTSEWVGIDGVSDTSLIQAGATEEYDPATAAVDVWAWWEIIPDPATPISMTVSAGDRMSVAIAQVSGSSWSISITDLTTGEQFTTTQTYTGPGQSAEWIVEAPTEGSTGTEETLGSYDPAVAFSDLATTGAETSISQDVMIQGGTTVSVPSALGSNGFAVAYGSAAPPAP